MSSPESFPNNNEPNPNAEAWQDLDQKKEEPPRPDESGEEQNHDDINKDEQPGQPEQSEQSADQSKDSAPEEGKPEAGSGERKGDHAETKSQQTEKQLNEVQSKLNEIKNKLKAAEEEQGRLDREIEVSKDNLRTNKKEYDSLVEADRGYRAELKESRNKLGQKCRELLFALMGGLDKFADAYEELGEELENTKRIKNQLEENTKQLKNNEEKKSDLENSINTDSQKKVENAKNITKLKQDKSRLDEKEKVLKEQVEHEKRVEDWEANSKVAKEEMKGRSLRRYERDMDRELEVAEKEFKEKCKEIEGKFSGAEIYAEAVRLAGERDPNTDYEKVEKKLKQMREEMEAEALEQYNNRVSEIRTKLQKVHDYYPVWHNRIKKIYDDRAVKGALATIKYKLLIGLNIF